MAVSSVEIWRKNVNILQKQAKIFIQNTPFGRFKDSKHLLFASRDDALTLKCQLFNWF
jgi:hypothetical protein